MDTFEWPFAADFHPDELDCEPGPQPWMLDWPAIIGLSSDERREYVEQLKEHGLEPEFGYRAPYERQVGLSPGRVTDNIHGFIDQSIIFEHAGRTYRLTATDDVPPGRCPIDLPVGFASLTPYTGELETDIPEFLTPPESWPVVGAIEANKRWTDQMTVADPIEVRAWVRAHKQPYYVIWTPGRGHGKLEVHSAQGSHVSATARAHLSLARRPCPMIEGSVVGQFCRMYGGPWVSASIIAFGRWSAERTNRLADVGCDTCGNGALRLPPHSGGGLTIVEGLEWPVTQRSDRWVTTSRYANTVTVRK